MSIVMKVPMEQSSKEIKYSNKAGTIKLKLNQDSGSESSSFFDKENRKKVDFALNTSLKVLGLGSGVVLGGGLLLVGGKIYQLCDALADASREGAAAIRDARESINKIGKLVEDLNKGKKEGEDGPITKAINNLELVTGMLLSMVNDTKAYFNDEERVKQMNAAFQSIVNGVTGLGENLKDTDIQNEVKRLTGELENTVKSFNGILGNFTFNANKHVAENPDMEKDLGPWTAKVCNILFHLFSNLSSGSEAGGSNDTPVGMKPAGAN